MRYTVGMSKQLQLDALQSEILTEGVCPDLATQATQLVMGAGNPDADIVIIGEAPGKKEDELGLPFVGASGKFLDAMLESTALRRDNIYITNIVKYRPPNNRDPSRAEKEAFWPYLLQQLAIIQPKLVVTLGRHSMNYFLPGSVIGDIHGQVVDVVIDGVPYRLMPLYHPAAAMYNGKLRQTLLDDFLRIPQVIDQLSS